MTDHMEVMKQSVDELRALTVRCPVCKKDMKLQDFMFFGDHIVAEFQDALHTFTVKYQVIYGIGGVSCLTPY